ncbi:hypothetical protein [Micavibrio aeruginosavorus]|uniref:hypothetical protein n=1 Tax=Micavibrio aeruginosavorus TaxID=349221 RepID=UPI003F4AD3C6
MTEPKTATAPDLTTPSDAELTATMGVPVCSLHIDDMPGLNADGTIDYDQISHRVEFLEDYVRRHIPAADMDGLERIAQQRSAQCVTFVEPHDNGTETILGFFMLKPSGGISAAQEMANSSGIAAHHIQMPLSERENDFLSITHEIGHMKATTEKIDFGTRHALYKEELYADTHALESLAQKFNDSSNKTRIIDAYVAYRAVNGFSWQGPAYWNAPQLAIRFHAADETGDLIPPMEIWESYAELRFRTVAKLIEGVDLDAYTSEIIKPALYAWGRHNTETITDPKIKNLMQRFHANTHSQEYKACRHHGAHLRTLDQIFEKAALSEKTAKHADQILSSARLICPTIF